MIPESTTAIGLAHSLQEKLVNFSDSGGEVNRVGNKGKTRWTTAYAHSVLDLATLL